MIVPDHMHAHWMADFVYVKIEIDLESSQPITWIKSSENVIISCACDLIQFVSDEPSIDDKKSVNYARSGYKIPTRTMRFLLGKQWIDSGRKGEGNANLNSVNEIEKESKTLKIELNRNFFEARAIDSVIRSEQYVHDMRFLNVSLCHWRSTMMRSTHASDVTIAQLFDGVAREKRNEMAFSIGRRSLWWLMIGIWIGLSANLTTQNDEEKEKVKSTEWRERKTHLVYRFDRIKIIKFWSMCGPLLLAHISGSCDQSMGNYLLLCWPHR